MHLGRQGAFKSSALWCVRAGKGLIDLRTLYNYLKPHYFNCKKESFAISVLYYKIRCYNLAQNTLVRFYKFYNFTLFIVERKKMLY